MSVPARTRGGSVDEARPVYLLVVAWCLFRVIGVSQAVLGSWLIIGSSTYPSISAILLIAIVLESAFLVVYLLRSRRLPGPRLVALDLAASLICVLAPVLIPTTNAPAGMPWYYSIVATTAALMALSRISRALLGLGVGAMCLAYVTGRYVDHAWPDIRVAVPGVAVLIMLVSVLCVGARHMVILSQRLEQARESNMWLAASAAVANERAAQRLFLHDTAGLLSMIANTSDPELGRVLRERAGATSQDLRRFIYQERDREVEGTRSLQALLLSLAGEFGELHIEHNLLTVQNVHLNSEMTGVVRSAVRTILDNVRTHSGAQNVTLHATSDGEAWEITVRDDGVGFDVATTPKGFGLRDQVESQCELNGIRAEISSRPGEGAVVTLRGVNGITSRPPARRAVSDDGDRPMGQDRRRTGFGPRPAWLGAHRRASRSVRQ